MKNTGILLIFAFVLLFGMQARAVDLADFHGTWKEVGYRCIGETDFKPRPFPGYKTFSIGYFVYTHRYDSENDTNCPYVQSSGTLRTGSFAGSRWLEIYPRATASTSCYNDTLVDDFVVTRGLWLAEEDIRGETYMIIGGDPVYVDPSCKSDPTVQRVYAKSRAVARDPH